MKTTIEDSKVNRIKNNKGPRKKIFANNNHRHRRSQPPAFVLLCTLVILSLTSSSSSAWSLTPKSFSSLSSAKNNNMMQRRKIHNSVLPILHNHRGGGGGGEGISIEDDKDTTSDSITTTGGASAAVTTPTNNNIQYRLSVMAVLVSSFLNLLGFTMAGPITPALGTHFNLEVGASFGSLTSAYPLGMLVGLFCWPSLSDTKLGRPTVISLSLLGTGCGLALQSYLIATHRPLKWFLASRVLTGTFAGSSPVSKAYLADVASAWQKRKSTSSSKKIENNGNNDNDSMNLAQLLAYRDAASTLAFLVGPLMGGIAYSTSSSLEKVIGISAIASVLAGIVVGFLVKSVPTTTNTKKNNNKGEVKIENDDSLISCPLGTSLWAGVATVCMISFLFHVGDSTFHAFFSQLLKQNSLSASNIGLAYTALAAISFSISTLIGRRGGSKKKMSPVKQCASGLTAIGLGLITMGLYSTTSCLPILGAAALYYCGVPLYSPSIPTMLLQCVPPYRRGFILGLDGIINTIARIASPLFMGTLYRTKGPKVAFGVAGSAALLAAILAIFKRIMVIRSTTMTTKDKEMTA